ncbi:MAG: universal stress protein [Acidimicrobiales bacterium]|nr:universal stress protein [Acidimicrobiales bacterium]
MTTTSKRRIVVGVEGSGGAKAALRWAFKEARFRDAVVEVVTAFVNTYVPASPDFNYVPLDPVDLEGEVRKMQGAVIDEVLAEFGGDPGVEVRRLLLRGRAADTLISAADGADMLVVGSRGRGGFRGLLLGSVSQQIAQHGSCPVVIVRPDLIT